MRRPRIRGFNRAGRAARIRCVLLSIVAASLGAKRWQRSWRCSTEEIRQWRNASSPHRFIAPRLGSLDGEALDIVRASKPALMWSPINYVVPGCVSPARTWQRRILVMLLLVSLAAPAN